MLIPDDSTRFNIVYFVRSNDEVSRYFRQNLADYRFTDMKSPVETARTDDAAELKGRSLVDLYREPGIRQEFTIADSSEFNGVVEGEIAIIELAGK